MKRRSLGLKLIVIAAAVCSFRVVSVAQQITAAETSTISTETASAVPKVVNCSGTLMDLNGKPLTGVTGVTFLLYKDAQGGAPLWLETQNVHPSKAGQYSVTLGSATSQGLPQDVFVSGEARWLGVQIEGQPEQPRVLLVAVPYALKAHDAETIGGLPASAFMLAAPTTGSVASSASGTPATTSSGPLTASNVTTSGGTVNQLPLWTTATNIESSVVTQTGSGTTAKIGVGTKTPATTVDINGAETVRGALTLPSTGTATSTAGKNSQPDLMIASVFNSGTASAVAQKFQLQAEPVNNDKTTASGTLNLLYGSGTATPAETGLKINNKGQITFATGQTFPGTGTITGVTAGTDLTGGGSSGKVTLNLDTTKVPQLNTANIFTGNQAVIGNLSATNEVSAGSTPTGNVASGTVEVDGAAVNNGSWSPALNFGGGGEVIASNRAGSTNQYGLDFFTNYTSRLSVTNTGLVGIGVQSPGWMLEVNAPDNSRQGSAIFGANDTGSGVGAFYGLYVAGGYDITNVSFNSAGEGARIFGGSSNVGFGGDGVDAYAGTGALANGYAGYFSGDVFVTGNLSKGGGSFKIDHPLDPANKYLYHSFVESPDMMNIYNGNVMLDANGEAVLELPEWFGALNRDYRYQLTCIGGFAPVYIAGEISNNQFKIAGGKSGMKVSWQVTGVRQDAWANAHRIPVEVQKPERERGYYIHPELYGAPEEKGVGWARHPDMMRRTKTRQAKLAPQSTYR